LGSVEWYSRICLRTIRFASWRTHQGSSAIATMPARMAPRAALATTPTDASLKRATVSPISNTPTRTVPTATRISLLVIGSLLLMGLYRNVHDGI
jgi:hypothetical protein